MDRHSGGVLEKQAVGSKGKGEKRLEGPSGVRRSSGAWRVASGLEMKPHAGSVDQSLALVYPLCPKATGQGEDRIKNPALKGRK